MKTEMKILKIVMLFIHEHSASQQRTHQVKGFLTCFWSIGVLFSGP